MATIQHRDLSYLEGHKLHSWEHAGTTAMLSATYVETDNNRIALDTTTNILYQLLDYTAKATLAGWRQVTGPQWSSGTADPTVTPPSDPYNNNGDYYFETDSLKFWQKQSETWTTIATFTVSQLNADMDGQGYTINNLVLGEIAETVYECIGTSLDPGNGSVQYKTLSETTTFTENFTTGQAMTFHLLLGSSYIVNWPTMTWVSTSGNIAPVLLEDDIIVFWKEGSTLYGSYVGSAVS